MSLRNRDEECITKGAWEAREAVPDESASAFKGGIYTENISLFAFLVAHVHLPETQPFARKLALSPLLARSIRSLGVYRPSLLGPACRQKERERKIEREKCRENERK